MADTATTTAPAKAVGELAPQPSRVRETPATTPRPTETTAPAPVSAASPVLPLPTLALIGAACIGFIGCGWYARRHWIRRQNLKQSREN